MLLILYNNVLDIIVVGVGWFGQKDSCSLLKSIQEKLNICIMAIIVEGPRV